ncbi:MAG: DUF6383 domain-containing protein, partial [Muribaculaceae bacterium]|nr:DUF6383 domain-containing protein [Muribaculaceae bacterium]
GTVLYSNLGDLTLADGSISLTDTNPNEFKELKGLVTLVDAAGATAYGNAPAGKKYAFRVLEDKGIATSVEGIASNNATVIAGDNQVVVLGAENATITVVNIAGSVIANIPSASANETIALEAGMYIVKVNAQATKVVVK